jgi:ATP-dependent exoDNAse (exonuclease V) alpha subunit
MTVNKSQSQGFGYVLLDATSEPFTHGQSYVACSRASDKKNIRMYVTEDNLHQAPGDPRALVPTLKNTVFKEVIKFI